MESENFNYINDEYENIYEDNFLNYDSYYFDENTDEKYFYNLPTNQRYRFMDEDLMAFKNLMRNRKIKILKKPSLLGWFVGGVDKEEDIKYTYEKYREKLLEERRNSRIPEDLRRKENLRRRNERLEKESDIEEERRLGLRSGSLKIIKEKRIRFKNNYPKITQIFKDFIMENDEQLNNLLDSLLTEKNLLEPEVYHILIEEARRKYNFQKDQYNENVKNFSQLSISMKEKTKKMGKYLDKFLAKLKPIVKDFKERNRLRDETLKSQILKEEQKKIQESARKIEADKKRKIQQHQEEIEDLEYKIRDAESKYSMNKAKFRKIDFKVQQLEKLKSAKRTLEEKIKNKNTQISERKNLIQKKSEIDEKLKSLDSLKSQLADLKSKIPSLSVFEQEKILRQKELDSLKKLNETSLRTKNANLRSLELEKKREEIRILEEQRYQEEKRQEEELNQLKIVFLKEKKIAQKRIDQLKWESKSRKIKLENIQKINLDLEEQKQKLSQILTKKQSALRDKQLEIERQKIQTLEMEKQKLNKKSEQQQLYSDSLKRDVDDLESQKQILNEITKNNKKILSNTKQEISNRQKEIEKTISLNMENAKKSANEIYEKEAKMKLDVFQTLSEVKNQVALKSDVENTLENLKDEILRKEAVSDLLSDTIDSIANKEISDIETYNNYLESEIEFKKKLANENLTFTEKQEALNDEKEDLIDRLERVKSQKMKKIYQTREKAIEQQMKILLIEGADELKNELFSLKFEIQNLESQKEISERKEDLAKFQSDNAKRELKLREQEIELLKNIRIKVLETERRTIRNEARMAIQDMVKSIENETRNQDVREKLDEILDDVESKEISKNTKASLYSILDKIETQEIHNAAKEKLDFILDKIELHDNIDESRKSLNFILDSIENEQIRQEVETKLDEILDDIEFDDYDFLEDDNLDKLLKDVKKSVAPDEQKIEKILTQVRQEDAKLKMDENIEMKERNPPPETSEGVGETSFDEFSDYNFFINNIEDPILKEKTRTFLGKIDGFEKEEEKIPKIKNAYKSAINSALWEDQLDTDFWDGNIILDEKAKFLYEQKVNNINSALGVDYGIHIDPTDMRIREFLDIKLTETKSEKREEINGYKYNGEKIISRNISRNFFFNYIKKPVACQRFIDELKNIINKTAKSQIVAESFFEGKAVKDCAMEYIGELREEQSYQIDSARNATEMRNALRDANDIDKDIKNLKKNLPFKMRMKIFKRTLSWRFTKLLRLLWKHKGKMVAAIFTIIGTTIGILLNQLGVIAVVHNLKKAARSVKQYANDVHDMGKRIIQNIQSLYGIPGKMLGWSLIFLGLFLKTLYFFTRLSGTSASGWIFGIFGSLIEISIYFSSNVETINEKASEILEESGNVIENAGIRSQKFISKNMPRWYYDKPVEERTVLQHIEAGAANVIFKVAKGTQYTGKKVQDVSETMKKTLFYTQAFLVVIFALLILNFIRNYLL